MLSESVSGVRGEVVNVVMDRAGLRTVPKGGGCFGVVPRTTDLRLSFRSLGQKGGFCGDASESSGEVGGT